MNLLSDLVLPTRANQHWTHSGIDSPDRCLNRGYFEQYPHTVEYNYNSRGFRDCEWPNTVPDLQKSIWCVGDSFTVGLGSPREHAWTHILQQQSGRRAINVSMDGASNNWIARRSCDILNAIQPDTMILHWSYLHRRESTVADAQQRQWKNFYNIVKTDNWPSVPEIDKIDSLPEYIQTEIRDLHKNSWQTVSDENRILHEDCNTDQEDIVNTIDCINLVEQNKKNTQVIHSFIPQFAPDKLKKDFLAQIHNLNLLTTSEIKQLDWARDYHHYDIKTASNFVSEILKIMQD